MDRRNFIALGGTALLANGTKTAAQNSVDESSVAPKLLLRKHSGPPNILMIMADQLRFDCVGAYGNKVVHTPHLDRIARDGIRFQTAYSCTPSCTPARSALLTGLGPWRNGMLGYSDMSKKSYPFEKASALAAAGYYTTSIGKNHYNPINNPHGYEHLITDEHNPMWFKDESAKTQPLTDRSDYESWFWSTRPDKDPYATGLGWNDRTGKPFAYPEELHPTHWTGTTATRFIEQYDRTEPFFLKVSFIRPHCPYDPPERLFKMYADAELPKAEVADWASRYEPRSDTTDALWHGKLSQEEIRNSRQGYYASITHVDEQLGRILKALEERKMLDDTFIVFFSDHGDMLGDQNLWRKTYAYESSAHIPMLVRPAASMHLETNRVIAEPVEIRDMLPTFLDVAGALIPDRFEGRSILKLARGKMKDWREYIDLEHNVCYGITNHWNALTDGKWKYIFHAYDGEEQLFHLQDDPHELHDLAKSPEHVETLALWRGRLVSHLKERGEDWVKDGKLCIRQKGQAFSPNFPDHKA